MHSRRIAAFLLGAWVACSLFADLMLLDSHVRSTGWESLQLPLAGVLIVTLLFASTRRMFPVGVCLVMAAAALAERFTIPGIRYVEAESLKLALSVILASWLFVMHAAPKKTSRRFATAVR